MQRVKLLTGEIEFLLLIKTYSQGKMFLYKEKLILTNFDNVEFESMDISEFIGKIHY